MIDVDELIKNISNLGFCSDCGIDLDVIIQAADALKQLQADNDDKAITLHAASNVIAKLQSENKALRNELCQKCGMYRHAHEGCCDGCKWRTDNV